MVKKDMSWCCIVLYSCMLLLYSVVCYCCIVVCYCCIALYVTDYLSDAIPINLCGLSWFCVSLRTCSASADKLPPTVFQLP